MRNISATIFASKAGGGGAAGAPGSKVAGALESDFTTFPTRGLRDWVAGGLEAAAFGLRWAVDGVSAVGRGVGVFTGAGGPAGLVARLGWEEVGILEIHQGFKVFALCLKFLLAEVGKVVEVGDWPAIALDEAGEIKGVHGAASGDELLSPPCSRF